MTKAKVGDTIIVTIRERDSTGETCVVIEPQYLPSRVDDMSEMIWVRKKDGHSVWLRHSSYEIIEDNPKTEIAKPGDTILVTNNSYEFLVGCEFLVIESGDDELPHGIKHESEIVWIVQKNFTNGSIAWLIHADYKIVKRANPTTTLLSCPDCNNTGTIELFTSTVKCGCKK
jgi:hypothetical protein